MAESTTKPTAAKKTSTTSAAKAKTAAPKSAAAAKKPAAPRKTAARKAAPGAEERYRMIEVAAYYIAERSGFTADPLASWAEAEKQIDRMLAK